MLSSVADSVATVVCVPLFTCIRAVLLKATLVGATASTLTLVVLDTLFRVSVASLPAASRRVPPLAERDPTAMPSVSSALACTVWRNTSALVPLPET